MTPTPKTHGMHKFEMEHVFSYSAQLAPPELIAPMVEGARAHFYIQGGSVQGPRLRGTFKAVGADWYCLRRDGIGEVDVRTTVLTDDGALIYVSYRGLSDLGEAGYEKFLRGETPPKVALRTAPMLRTAHADYQWLHRLFFVGIGEIDMGTLKAEYDVYSIR